IATGAAPKRPGRAISSRYWAMSRRFRTGKIPSGSQIPEIVAKFSGDGLLTLRMSRLCYAGGMRRTTLRAFFTRVQAPILGSGRGAGMTPTPRRRATALPFLFSGLIAGSASPTLAAPAAKPPAPAAPPQADAGDLPVVEGGRATGRKTAEAARHD